MDCPSKKRKLETTDTTDSPDGIENEPLRKKKAKTPPVTTHDNDSDNDDSGNSRNKNNTIEPFFNDWSTSDLLDHILDEPCLSFIHPPVNSNTNNNNNLSLVEHDTPPEQVVLSLLHHNDSTTDTTLPFIDPNTERDKHVSTILLDDIDLEQKYPTQLTLDPVAPVGSSPSTSVDTKVIIEVNSPESTSWDDDDDADDMDRPVKSSSPPPPPPPTPQKPMDTQTQSLQHTKPLQLWNEVLTTDLKQLKSHPIQVIGREMRKHMILDTDVLTPGCYKTLKLWWFDAHQHYRKGVVYLFGKVLNHVTGQYTSCCVLVKNIPRTIYVLPRLYHLNKDGDSETIPVTMNDVKDEITKVLERHNIHSWKSSVRSRKYAFGLDDIPLESDYLKIQYSFEDPELPGDINGNTFSHIFGTNNTPMELFLIKRHIKGPQWLEIKEAQFCNGPTQETWCHYEFTVSSPKYVNLIKQDGVLRHLPAPPISVLSLNLTTSPNPKTFTNEIIAAAILFCPKVMLEKVEDLNSLENARFAVARPWGTSTNWPSDLDDAMQREKRNGLTTRIEDSEYALLNYLCAKIHLCDPDVIVGHGFSRFTLDILLHRMKVCKTSFWHKIGRLRWRTMPKLQMEPGGAGISTSREKGLLVGRLVCDTMIACRTLILTKSYNLGSLAETQLGIHKDESRPWEDNDSLDKSKATVHLLRHCWMDAYLSMLLLFKFQFLPLTKKLTNIAGNLWSRSLEGSRMNRNEFLLLHEFHQLKYICPDKVHSDFQGIELEGLEGENVDSVLEKPRFPLGSKQSKKKGPSYGGGLLLEPKIGLYEQFVVLLDFNSLYPSIIQEFNICFTTVDAKKIGDETLLPNVPGPEIPLGVLPKLMKRFVDERKQVKLHIKDPGLDENAKMQYDIEQNALKLTANSLYGSLGSGFSRFSAKHLAAMITSQGRSILRDTVDSVEQQLNMDVVYGDTDSIMIATNESTMEAAQVIARKVQEVINGRYQLLELGIDGYFRRLLVLGKKNYASLTMVKEKEEDTWGQVIKPKGSNVIRKDVSELSLFTTMRVLKVILSDEPHKKETIHDALKRINQQVRSGGVPLTKFVIHKQLTKDLDSYTNTKGQTHIQVALKMRKAGHIIKGGDTVAYVVCLTGDDDDDTNVTIVDKVAPLSEVESGSRTLDYEWYFQHEILPSVTRLCEPIMDTTNLATCFGLTLPEPSHTTRRRQQRQQRQPSTRSSSDATEDFKRLERTTGVEHFRAMCQYCQGHMEITGYTRYDKDKEGWVCGFQCQKCHQIISYTSLACQLELAIRYYIQRYYQGWLVCQELDCDYRTRDCILRCTSPAGCHGMMTREYSEDKLYAQLLHLDSLFDPKNDDHDPTKQTIIDQYGQAFKVLQKTTRKYLDLCSYRFIDVGDYAVAYDDIE